MNTSKTPKTLAVAMPSLVWLAVIVLVCGTLVYGGAAFAQDEAALLGDWTGDSICQVKDSPCRDERVVYHLTRGKSPGVITVNADKIVDGKAVPMGPLDFTYDSKTGTLLNETAGRVWKLTVRGKKIEGTLTHADKTIYRRLSLKKEA